MSATGLWMRLGTGIALAVMLLVVAAPPKPGPWLASAPVAVGLCAGLALFVALARVRLPLPWSLAALLLAVAGGEEVVWRWFLLGELTGRVGAAAALGVSACLFGLVHVGSRFLHTATGLAFGAVYLATGSLLAAWAAHGAYNLAVATAARRPASATG